MGLGLPRQNLCSPPCRRRRARDFFAARSKPHDARVENRKGSSASNPEVLVAKAVPCPVCLHDDPGDLEKHLVRFHDVYDLRYVLEERLRHELPGVLRFLVNSGQKRILSRVLVNFLLTGFLQVPSLPGPRPVTRVLWRAEPSNL